VKSVTSPLLLATITLAVGCFGDGPDAEDSALFEDAYANVQTGGKADGTCNGVVVPDRRGFGKHVALTFDDGPNPATTPAVIEVLKRHHAPATFFNNGSRYAAPGAAALAARIAADPDYLLGNHSQHHLNLAVESDATVATEIDQTDRLIRAAGPSPRYFRFPFGSATCADRAAVESRGYVITGWHIDSADWCYAAGGGTCAKATFKYVPDELRDDMRGYVMSQVRATGGGVILFHDIHRHTADHLDEILTAMEAEGFTFARLDDAAVFPKLNGKPAPAVPAIGDACLADTDCAFTAGGAAGRCHPAGYCTVTCQGYCTDTAGKAPTFCIADPIAPGAGMCAPKPATINQSCAALPGSVLSLEPRFVGKSGVPAATANVCAPR
jgi:peptidoglycan/xylan/chitin deacetylase (PgdA/CDA1 family)